MENAAVMTPKAPMRSNEAHVTAVLGCLLIVKTSLEALVDVHTSKISGGIVEIFVGNFLDKTLAMMEAGRHLQQMSTRSS
jgi:hypothetical protein